MKKSTFLENPVLVGFHFFVEVSKTNAQFFNSQVSKNLQVSQNPPEVSQQPKGL
jgi:hypothetical protein